MGRPAARPRPPPGGDYREGRQGITARTAVAGQVGSVFPAAGIALPPNLHECAPPDLTHLSPWPGSIFSSSCARADAPRPQLVQRNLRGFRRHAKRPFDFARRFCAVVELLDRRGIGRRLWLAEYRADVRAQPRGLLCRAKRSRNTRKACSADGLRLFRASIQTRDWTRTRPISFACIWQSARPKASPGYPQ